MFIAVTAGEAVRFHWAKAVVILGDADSVLTGFAFRNSTVICFRAIPHANRRLYKKVFEQLTAVVTVVSASSKLLAGVTSHSGHSVGAISFPRSPIMGNVAELLGQKQKTHLQWTRSDATVLAATQQMNEFGIGALLVCDDQKSLVGIFTERDVLRRVVAAERVPATVRVSEVMTSKVACCTPTTSIDEARSIFRQHRIRHLPVIGGSGEVEGLISIGDLNAHDTNHKEVTIHYLHEYLHGRT